MASQCPDNPSLLKDRCHPGQALLHTLGTPLHKDTGHIGTHFRIASLLCINIISIITDINPIMAIVIVMRPETMMRPHRLVAMARWQSFGVGHFLLSLRALTDQPAQLHAPSLFPSFSPQPSPLPPPSPSSSFSSSSCAKFILKKINVDFNKHIICRSSSLLSSSFFPLRSNLVSPGRIYIGSAALLSLSQYTGSTFSLSLCMHSSYDDHLSHSHPNLTLLSLSQYTGSTSTISCSLFF